MTGILFVIVIIYCNRFKCNYLRNKPFFSQFFLAFLKFISNFEHFGKMMILIAYVFLKLETAKEMVS